MAECSKFHTRIEIKPSSSQISADLDDNLQDQKIDFFKSGSQKRGDTWVISVFVILHIMAFIATMAVNDCWTNSHGVCAFKALGRFSFQPLSENPLLGPSASKLDEMGALQRIFLTEHHQTWRLFTFPVLHGGAIHLVINLCSVIFVGIHLEKEFGPLRIGIVYVLSALFGALVAALFIQNTPAVGSSGALYGLLGAMLSALIRNWKFYTNKVAAVTSLICVSVINFSLGLLPYIDNFSNIGGFVSGILLGFLLLFSPQVSKVSINKRLFDTGVKSSIKLKLKQKLDRPVLRSVSLILFIIVLAGCLVAVLRGVNINQYCRWCRYVDCVPFQRWQCKSIATSCETMVSNAQLTLTLTCMSNGKYKVFPFTNLSQLRINDFCSLICL
ncbi:Rhomboid-like protein [Quillaja saponaria]|uniref:RHOMBOID-like protein n=1 Tax=Quillaja saponaria TaxID=32244 RepID=A0AAD7LWP5_QUISA|nr:Rhomboid-like protein [Quillaja saponaria]